MVHALIRWWNPVTSSESLDVLHWAMHPTLYRCICMAIYIASNCPAFLLLFPPTILDEDHVMVVINSKPLRAHICTSVSNELCASLITFPIFGL
jgi:hypothetical protein